MSESGRYEPKLLELSSIKAYLSDPSGYRERAGEYNLLPQSIHVSQFLCKGNYEICRAMMRMFYKSCADVIENPDDYSKEEMIKCILHFCRQYDYHYDYADNLFYRKTFSPFNPTNVVTGDETETQKREKDNKQYYNRFENLIAGYDRSQWISLVNDVHTDMMTEETDQYMDLLEYPEHLGNSYYINPELATNGFIEYGDDKSSGGGYDDLYADEILSDGGDYFQEF